MLSTILILNFWKILNLWKVTNVWKKCLPSAPKMIFSGPNNFSWATEIWAMRFLQKTALDLVKYGLHSLAYNLPPHIGGRHSVLYFTIQATKKYSNSNVLTVERCEGCDAELRGFWVRGKSKQLCNDCYIAYHSWQSGLEEVARTFVVRIYLEYIHYVHLSQNLHIHYLQIRPAF